MGPKRAMPHSFRKTVLNLNVACIPHAGAVQGANRKPIFNGSESRSGGPIHGGPLET